MWLRNLAALAFVAAMSMVTTGCIRDCSGDDACENIVSFNNTKTNAEVAYDNSKRVALLLEVCGSPACLALKSRVSSKGFELIGHVNTSPRPGEVSEWYNKERRLVTEYQALKAEAYRLLIDSGISSQDSPSPGYWDSTFWDVSSP